ncbi:hypothetical protein BO83DRAFT_324280 [Aspergillus eucalypticola CBS 122712]|uniref:Uncharacterized protein n=1 Tax=Aspergillus eucalypticola (strain CBS 122712 / IBT 29274) TaxID=1448314 RepID=A0A317UN99_ASPEC|nr:uncharacterized protein BO83DRAFT_324280 [Aspergillus eucalypticola CBS 122712]PWY63414.1 hypothetical protein BO83DRAFT_324280 [Aspergillus eucalypticola CBS 122712]
MSVMFSSLAAPTTSLHDGAGDYAGCDWGVPAHPYWHQMGGMANSWKTNNQAIIFQTKADQRKYLARPPAPVSVHPSRERVDKARSLAHHSPNWFLQSNACPPVLLSFKYGLLPPSCFFLSSFSFSLTFQYFISGA